MEDTLHISDFITARISFFFKLQIKLKDRIYINGEKYIRGYNPRMKYCII
jgi:hypothetical protein